MSVRAVLRRLLGSEPLPPGFPGLEPDERVVAVAATADGAHVVVTSFGLWLPEGDADAPGFRRVGWHLVSRAVWRNGALAVVEAEERERLAGDGGPEAVLLADRPTRRFRLADPGRVPEAVHARVEASIRSRHHRDRPGGDLPGGDLPGGGAAGGNRSGGGAWFVQRKVPGRDGTVLQVRPDPGTDPALVAQLAADVARSLRAP